MKHVRESIQAFVSGHLDAGRSEEVRTHLAACPECRLEADQTRETWDLLGAVEEGPAAGGSIWPAVRESTVGRDDRAREWFFGHGTWMRSVLAAGAVAAGLVGGIMIPAGLAPETAETTVDDAAWLVEATWLSGSSWLSDSEGTGLDDILLGVGSAEQENGS